MTKKERIVMLVEIGRYTIRSLCEDFGISVCCSNYSVLNKKGVACKLCEYHETKKF